MSLSVVNISPILKEYSEPGWDRKMLVNGHPLMTQLDTDTDAMVGDYFKVPIQYARPAGRSHDAATAYAAEYGSKYKAFEVTPITDYLTFRMAGQVVRKAKESKDATAFANAVMQEVQSAIEGLGDNVAKEFYGNVGGYRGRVHPTTAISTTSLTLAYPSQAVNFSPGMQICAGDTDGTSGSLRDSGDYVTLVSVSISTGVLVADANWSNIASIAANDYLFQRGDFGVSLAGLESWNPATAPGATSFFNVDRSVAPDFLGGMRGDLSSTDSLESAFITMDALTSIQVGNPFKEAEYFINPITMGSLQLSKEGQRFIDDGNEYQIGIKKFRTSQGHVLVPDRDCPQGIARLIAKDALVHCTIGNQPALSEVDGIEMVWDVQNDLYTAQVVIDHALTARKPQGLARFILPTA